MKHGAKRNYATTPEYVVWSLMRDRCNNPANGSYAYYGGRGISVCDRWSDFAVFLADMGKRPAGFTLDRKDGNRNYEPDNCQWASRKDQSRNRDYCRRVTWQGSERLLWELAEEHGIPNHLMHQRLYRGWSLDRVFTQPIRSPR